jgi:hypothetical protein
MIDIKKSPFKKSAQNITDQGGRPIGKGLREPSPVYLYSRTRNRENIILGMFANFIGVRAKPRIQDTDTDLNRHI